MLFDGWDLGPRGLATLLGRDGRDPTTADRDRTYRAARIDTLVRSYVYGEMYTYVTLARSLDLPVDLLYRYRYRIGKINPSLSALSSLFPVVPLGIDRCHGTLNKLPR